MQRLPSKGVQNFPLADRNAYRSKRRAPEMLLATKYFFSAHWPLAVHCSSSDGMLDFPVTLQRSSTLGTTSCPVISQFSPSPGANGCWVASHKTNSVECPTFPLTTERVCSSSR